MHNIFIILGTAWTVMVLSPMLSAFAYLVMTIPFMFYLNRHKQKTVLNALHDVFKINLRIYLIFFFVACVVYTFVNIEGVEVSKIYYSLFGKEYMLLDRIENLPHRWLYLTGLCLALELICKGALGMCKGKCKHKKKLIADTNPLDEKKEQTINPAIDRIVQDK